MPIHTQTVEEALLVAKQLKKGLETAGQRYFDPPFSQIQLCITIQTLAEAYNTLVTTAAEEVALANRRYAAANARNAKAAKAE